MKRFTTILSLAERGREVGGLGRVGSDGEKTKQNKNTENNWFAEIFSLTGKD